MVEAAGVEPDNPLEAAQLIDSEIARFGRNSTTSESTVRSLHSPFLQFPGLPNSTFGRLLLAKRAFWSAAL